MTGTLEIRLLGRFSARRFGEEIPRSAFGGRLVQGLLRILLVHRGASVPSDVLAEALWPGRLPADPSANLPVLINRARRALGDPSLIATSPGGYWFTRDDRCQVDTELFQERSRAGHELLVGGDLEGALRILSDALELWIGEPLAEDVYSDWSREYRSELERSHLAALEDAAAIAIALCRPYEAVSYAERAVVKDPFRERSNVLLATALRHSGDRPAALRLLDAWSARVADELALEPSSEVTELQDLLRHERDTRSRVLGPNSPSSGTRRTTPMEFGQLRFVGRDAEMAAILDALGAVPPRRVLIAGHPGMGKSRLLAEIGNLLDRPVLRVGAVLPEREEAWGLARSLLREALNLVPGAARELPDNLSVALAAVIPELEEFRRSVTASLDAESRRALTFEAGFRLMHSVAAVGAAVTVDDLQWADPTSLAFLAMLLGRVPDLPVALSYRPGHLRRGAALTEFLQSLKTTSAPVDLVELGRLEISACEKLVDDAELARVLVEDTDGSPLAVSEVLRALAVDGLIQADSRGIWTMRAADVAARASGLARIGQRRAVQSRAEQESPARQELLLMLALLRREVPARTIAAARGERQIEVLDDLDALALAGLVRLEDGGWTCAHQLVADFLIETLNRAERGRLHQLLADALTQERADPAEIARHLTGAGDRQAASEAFSIAARQRLDAFAGDEAVTLADEGLSLRPHADTRAALHEIRGESRALVGNLAGAREDIRAAIRVSDHGPARSHLLSRLAMLTTGAEGYAKAEELVTLALAEAGVDPKARAEALTVAAIIDQRNAEQAEQRALEAIQLSRQIGDAAQLAAALDAHGLTAFARGEVSKAADMFDQVARLYQEAGKLTATGTPRATRGWLLRLMGRPEQGLADANEALALERTLGQIEGEAISLLIKAQLLASVGDAEGATADATSALELSRRVGNREWIAFSLIALATAAQAGGDADRADACFSEAVDEAHGLRFTSSYALGALASSHMARHNHALADRFARESIAAGNTLSQYEATVVLAELAIARGDDGAVERAIQLVEFVERAGYRSSPARTRFDALLRRLRLSGQRS